MIAQALMLERCTSGTGSGSEEGVFMGSGDHGDVGANRRA